MSEGSARDPAPGSDTLAARPPPGHKFLPFHLEKFPDGNGDKVKNPPLQLELPQMPHICGSVQAAGLRLAPTEPRTLTQASGAAPLQELLFKVRVLGEFLCFLHKKHETGPTSRA